MSHSLVCEFPAFACAGILIFEPEHAPVLLPGSGRLCVDFSVHPAQPNEIDNLGLCTVLIGVYASAGTRLLTELMLRVAGGWRGCCRSCCRICPGRRGMLRAGLPLWSLCTPLCRWALAARPVFGS